jgi:predicted MFS family arabinose efflux permease
LPELNKLPVHTEQTTNDNQKNKAAAGINVNSYRWTALVMNTALQTMQSVVSTSTGVLAPFVVADLGLTKAMIGFAGGAVNIGMSGTALLAGRLADKKGEKPVLAVGAIMAGLAITLASRAVSFYTLAAALLFTGLWSSTTTPAGSKAMMKWFPPDRLGLALGIRQTGVPLGGFIGALLLPVLAQNWGWRTAMAAAGCIVIIGGVGFYISYKDFPAPVEQAGKEKEQSPGGSWTFLRNAGIWLAILAGLVFQGSQFIMLTYLVLYLRDSVGLKVAVASLCLAAAQLGGIAGRVGLGYFSDVFFHGARKPVLIMEGVLLTAVTVSLSAFHAGTPFGVMALVSWFFGLSAMGWSGLHIALITKLAGQEQGGAAVGLCIALLQAGTLLFPPLFGHIIDMTGSYRLSWLGLAFAALLGTSLVLRVREPAGKEKGESLQA